MLNEFSKNSTYSINFNNLMKLKKKKLIKKVLCGFLQNILVKTHKNN